MSKAESCPHDTESCVNLREGTEDGSDGSADRDTKCVSNNSSCSDSSDRQRVLKEVGLTSTTFIGPVFPPTATAVKSDIDDKLTEFYKELERIDTTDCAAESPETTDAGVIQPPVGLSPKVSTTNDVIDMNKDEVVKPAKKVYQKHPSRPHWYHNEPYDSRGPRPRLPRRPPIPQMNREPFHHPLHSDAFPNPHMPPSHANHSWSSLDMMNRHREESHFLDFPYFPPPDVYRHPSQGFNEDYSHHFDRDKGACSSRTFSDDGVFGWSRDGKEEWSQWDNNSDMHQRYASKNKQRDEDWRPPQSNNPVSDSSFVLILMRGLPGSGKSTLARELLATSPSGLILSTDDYFACTDGYRYEPELLPAAHEWNQRRAKDAMDDGQSPIIIDNTNTQAWEMKPYVKLALERGYQVEFCEPDTNWKFDPYELEKRNKHGVPHTKIARMLDRFSFPITVDIIMNSQEPLHVSQRQRPEQPWMKDHFH